MSEHGILTLVVLCFAWLLAALVVIPVFWDGAEFPWVSRKRIPEPEPKPEPAAKPRQAPTEPPRPWPPHRMSGCSVPGCQIRKSHSHVDALLQRVREQKRPWE
jgi:hypothetical protein